MEFHSINPANGEAFDTYTVLTDAELSERIEKSALANKHWGQLDLDTRIQAVLNLAKVLEEDKSRLARLISLEMGKLLEDSEKEIDKCVASCRHFAATIEEQLADRVTVTEAIKSYIAIRPLGTVLGIMPWNYPFWQTIRFAITALLVGNTILLKHSENVCGCALEIEKLFERSGFPEGVFQTLIIEISQIEQVVAHPAVQGVALTGSERAGKAIGQLAGKYLKPSVLELGGSDPYIVLDDADLDLAVRTCATARVKNAGQTCIAAKRLIVTPGIYKDFAATFEDIFWDFPFGDPMLESSGMGPLAREDLRANLQRQVDLSVQTGAKLVMGGQIPEGPGFFYPATMLTDVTPGMPIFDDETFGPVVPLIQAKDTEDAIRLANASRYGLGAAIFSSDTTCAEEIARNQLEAGSCFVNAQVASSYVAPFGGVKSSGYGRELGEFGFLSFANVKNVYVD
ncbi:MAG: NAD-dependent succinate-semialdehyde dehydrogenase [Opitutales bacterium]